MKISNDQAIRVLGKGKTALGIKQRFPNATLYDDADFNEYDQNSNELTVVSPGIPPYNKMVQQAKNTCSDYDLVNMPFSIWISGTNGKTTTTQMVQHLLKDKGSLCGGNIGTPICALDEDAPIWILETSSFTFHYTSRAKPNLYLLLPICDDHLSWHGSFKEYEQAKLKPLSMMSEGEVAVVPSIYKDIQTDATLITYKDSDELCEIFDLNKERINFNEPFLLDALLALAAQKIIFDEVDYERINSYVVDKHKVEEFSDHLNRLWIDDSKATNVDATLNALVPYAEKKIHLVLGGDDKGADLEPLFAKLQSYDVELYTIGSNKTRLNELCEKYFIKFTSCEFLENAVNEISKKHDNKGVAMLSPAAASLDQFSSYKQRGEEFKKAVQNLSLN